MPIRITAPCAQSFPRKARGWRCILAGVARLYPSVQEGCRRVIRLNAPQEPIEENVPKYEAFYRMYTKLYPALKDCYKELAAL